MGINYPGGIDAFNVPTDPEDTPLSEAGTSTRNHVEWHADAGSAIVALEQSAAQLSHDHSGSINVTIAVTQPNPGTEAVNDLQTITLTGTPTAGTFNLTVNDETSVAIAYNAASSAIQSALQTILGTGNVSVTGSAGGPWQVTFIGALADTAIPTMSAQSSLTGGAVNITHITVGTAGTASVQLITMSAIPSSGTFTLSFGGQTTAALPWDASNTTVQNALAGLSSIGANNVSVAGDGPYTVTFQGTLGTTPQALITATSSLTSGLFATNKLLQVNTHQSPDTDTASTAIHHTIGSGATQAAAGNHTHVYDTLLQIPLEICTSSTRPASPQLGMQIWETDTNRSRIWASFPNNVLETGTSFTDTFNRASGSVGYSATGVSGSLSGGNNGSTTIVLGASDTAVLVGVTNYSSSAPWHSGWTTTVTVGGVELTQLGVMDNLGSLTGFITLFGVILSNPMPGEQVIEVTASNGSYTADLVIDSVSYGNVAAFGPVVTNAAALGFSFPLAIPSSPGDMVVGFFAGGQGVLATPTSIEGQAGTIRVNDYPGNPFVAQLIQDCPGALSTNLGVSSTALTNASIGVNLIVANSSLGTNYNQIYFGGASHPLAGSMAVPVSGSASWIVGENAVGRCIAVPTNSAVATTISNDQDFTFTTGTPMPGVYSSFSPTVDIYARMSANQQSYVRLSITSSGASLAYTTSGYTGELPLGSVLAGTQSPNIPWEFKVSGQNFLLYRGGVQVMNILDEQNVTVSGSANKGWAWGMMAIGGIVLGYSEQLPPATVTQFSVNDLPIYGTQPIWQLTNMGAVPHVRAETHVEQPVAVNNVVSAFWDTVIEDLWGFFGFGTIGVQTTIPQTTGVTIGEAGHYNIHASVPWDPAYYGFDQSMVGFSVNGQDIGRKTLQYMVGNTAAPGFPQTVEIYTSWHFAAGDVLRVIVSHNSVDTSWLFYNPGSPGLQMAWIDVDFTGP